MQLSMSWLLYLQLVALMIATIARPSVEIVIHGSIPTSNLTSSLLSSPVNVKVKEGDIYEIVVMAYGQTSDVEIWVELQNCIIHATDPPSLPCNDLALNRSITSDSSRNIRSVTFAITIDDAFIRLFGENETDISVTLYSGGKRGSNESANIHFVSNTMTENDPTDAPDCNTRVLPHTIDVTNYSNAQIDTQRSCSMKLGNVLPSAWLVSLCVSVLHFLSKLILEQF